MRAQSNGSLSSINIEDKELPEDNVDDVCQSLRGVTHNSTQDPDTKMKLIYLLDFKMLLLIFF